MKFSIDKHILLDPLKRVASALPSKNIIPILAGILFVSDENGLSLTAGNSFIFIRESIDHENFESNRAGSIVLPGARMVDIVTKSGDVLEVEVKGIEVTIRSGSNKFKLIGLESEDYPEIPDINNTNITLPGDLFKKAVLKTAFAASTEKNSPPIHTGVNFEIKSGRMKATATDSKRLARTEIPIETTEELSTVISKESLDTLVKLLPDTPVEFSFDYSGFIAKAKGMIFYSRVLEGTYPRVDHGFDSHFTFKGNVRVGELLAALENVDIVAKDDGKVHRAKMTVKRDCFEIEAKTEAGFADAIVDLDDTEGEGLVLAFNIKFMVEALKSLDSKEATISFNTAIRPIMIRSVENAQDVHLIFPYRIQATA